MVLIHPGSSSAVLPLFTSPRWHDAGTMLLQANKIMVQTYLDHYCIDTTLDNDQRTETLRHATENPNQANEVSAEMHLTHTQLFYLNGDKHEAYRHLELYLDD